MRVSNNPVQNSESTRTTRAGGAQGAQAAKKTDASAQAANASAAPATDGANANISAKGREFARAKEVAASAPDVREDKIAELKRRIAEGKYKVDSDAIADRMVDDHLRTGIG